MTLSADAGAWRQALADVLLPVDVNAGRPVRLNCDDDAVAAAGTQLGFSRADATVELVSCLHAERLVDCEDGVRAIARIADGQPPGYLLGLAILVLAASHMAGDELGSMAAYYGRLGKLLRIPLQPNWPQVRGVPELVERFTDLAHWMAGPQDGRRGVLNLPANVHPSVVGVPINQSLLRAGDRVTLGSFFERTSQLIDAGWDPVHQLRRWGGRHQLTQPFQALLDRPDLHPALAGALRAARRSWDGSTADASGKRLLPSQLALHLPPSPFSLSVTVPALSAPVTAEGPDGSPISLDALAPTSVPLEWLQLAAKGPVVVDAGAERVRLLSGPTMLFEITPLGMRSVAVVAEDRVWALTCDPVLIAACEDTHRLAAPLPEGWVLLCDVDSELLAVELRASRDEENRPLAGVRAEGGLRLGPDVWLLEHPPAITADLPEPVSVRIDGRAHRNIAPNQTLTLETIGHVEGVHWIEIGEHSLTLELARRGGRVDVGGLAFSTDPRLVYAGPMPRAGFDGASIAGALISPASGEARRWPLIVRYRCTVDVIDADGSVRGFGPPSPAAWLDHIGLPQNGPWEIPDAEHVVWLCVDVPDRKFVVCHQALDVPLSDNVLDVVEWYADTKQIIDRSDGEAAARWQRLTNALEDAA